jgi:hypothetical protein
MAVPSGRSVPAAQAVHAIASSLSPAQNVDTPYPAAHFVLLAWLCPWQYMQSRPPIRSADVVHLMYWLLPHAACEHRPQPLAPLTYPATHPSHCPFSAEVLWFVGHAAHARFVAAVQAVVSASRRLQSLHRSHVFEAALAYNPVGLAGVLHTVHVSSVVVEPDEVVTMYPWPHCRHALL